MLKGIKGNRVLKEVNFGGSEIGSKMRTSFDEYTNKTLRIKIIHREDFEDNDELI
jgi:hypothetical protein